MSKATFVQEPPELRPWSVQFANVSEPGSIFNINGLPSTAWFARWLVEAYNRDQPKKEDYV